MWFVLKLNRSVSACSVFLQNGLDPKEASIENLLLLYGQKYCQQLYQV